MENNLNMKPVILLIDGAHMLRRSMYQPALRELSNSKGMPTGAIYGFLNSLKSAVNSLSAQSLIVCWEGGHSERRQEVYADYKRRTYEEEPEKDEHGYTDYEYYCHQLSWIQKILECLGVVQLRVPGKEGDDVLFQASHLLNGQKIIVSEDSDFFALVREDVSVFRPIKREFVDEANFYRITETATPRHYLYYKVLAGDGSDNIPAIAKGVGWATIKKILEAIENPDDLSPARIIKEASQLKGSRFTKVVDAGASAISRNLDLIDISRETFNIFQLQEMADKLSVQLYPDVATAHKLLHALEFNPDTVNYIVNKLSLMSTYPLANLVDRSYIKRVLSGESSSLQG